MERKELMGLLDSDIVIKNWHYLMKFPTDLWIHPNVTVILDKEHLFAAIVRGARWREYEDREEMQVQFESKESQL